MFIFFIPSVHNEVQLKHSQYFRRERQQTSCCMYVAYGSGRCKNTDEVISHCVFVITVLDSVQRLLSIILFDNKLSFI